MVLFFWFCSPQWEANLKAKKIDAAKAEGSKVRLGSTMIEGNIWYHKAMILKV